jgi:hypothetical protein
LERKYLKQKRSSAGENLAFISAQHDVYPAELFQALVSARENGKAVCEDLVVEYRGSIDSDAIFLIRKDSVVGVQFRIAEDFLLEKNLAFDSWKASDRINKQIARQMAKQTLLLPTIMKIRDLRVGMKKVNLEARVAEIENPRLVQTQFGNSIVMANCWICDEPEKAGRIKICLWDEQMKGISAGDVVQISNSSVITYKGEKQLRLGKGSTIKREKTADLFQAK